MTKHYDFALIQHGVPLLRNPDTDIIRIDKAPVFYNRVS